MVIADGPLSIWKGARDCSNSAIRRALRCAAIFQALNTAKRSSRFLIYETVQASSYQVTAGSFLLVMGQSIPELLLSHHHGNDPRSIQDLFDEWLRKLKFWDVDIENIESEPQGDASLGLQYDRART